MCSIEQTDRERERESEREREREKRERREREIVPCIHVVFRGLLTPGEDLQRI